MKALKVKSRGLLYQIRGYMGSQWRDVTRCHMVWAMRGRDYLGSRVLNKNKEGGRKVRKEKVAVFKARDYGNVDQGYGRNNQGEGLYPSNVVKKQQQDLAHGEWRPSACSAGWKEVLSMHIVSVQGKEDVGVKTKTSVLAMLIFRRRYASPTGKSDKQFWEVGLMVGESSAAEG